MHPFLDTPSMHTGLYTLILGTPCVHTDLYTHILGTPCIHTAFIESFYVHPVYT